MTKKKYEACHNLFHYRHRFFTALKPRLVVAKDEIEALSKREVKQRRQVITKAFLDTIAEVEAQQLDHFGGVAVDTDLLSVLTNDCGKCIRALEWESHGSEKSDSSRLQLLINEALYHAFLRILWYVWVAWVFFQILRRSFGSAMSSAD